MHIPAALLPVLIFLTALFLLDTFKLVPVRWIAAALGAGATAAAAAYWLHAALPSTLDPGLVSRYVAPVTEEVLKGLPLAFVILSGRVGFLVDAAVLGFAVGAGFALVENVTYLRELPDATLRIWVARGVGTAVLHGATCAIFAMMSKALTDRRRRRRALMLLPGLAVAAGLHSAFNHLLLPPVAQLLVILIVMPLLVVWVFERSERATREWMGAGLDLDLQLLQLVLSEQFAATRFGGYLSELRSRFTGPTVADMYCLLRLELELSVQAKALIMARGAGVQLPADEDLNAILAEREGLKQSIGRTGLLALKPLQVTSHRDDWHRHLLHQMRKRRVRP
jgi:RsiW-degrading membrane proteinase PrsW (M82 family)